MQVAVGVDIRGSRQGRVVFGFEVAWFLRRAVCRRIGKNTQEENEKNPGKTRKTKGTLREIDPLRVTS